MIVSPLQGLAGFFRSLTQGGVRPGAQDSFPWAGMFRPFRPFHWTGAGIKIGATSTQRVPRIDSWRRQAIQVDVQRAARFASWFRNSSRPKGAKHISPGEGVPACRDERPPGLVNGKKSPSPERAAQSNWQRAKHFEIGVESKPKIVSRREFAFCSLYTINAQSRFRLGGGSVVFRSGQHCPITARTRRRRRS
jgi:hypothetical protein